MVLCADLLAHLNTVLPLVLVEEVAAYGDLGSWHPIAVAQDTGLVLVVPAASCAVGPTRPKGSLGWASGDAQPP